MHPTLLTSRLATRDDVPALTPLMRAAIDVLQGGHLDDASGGVPVPLIRMGKAIA